MPFRNRIVYVFALRKERVKEASQKKKKGRGRARGRMKEDYACCILRGLFLHAVVSRVMSPLSCCDVIKNVICFLVLHLSCL